MGGRWMLHTPLHASDFRGAVAAAMVLARSVRSNDVLDVRNTLISPASDPAWATRVFCARCVVPHPTGHVGSCIIATPR